ncbi:MAG: M48 family metallopeptidase [Candidatus Uhrbacteria bacterium]
MLLPPPLVHWKEPLYFGIALVVSVIIYLLLIFSIIGIVYILLAAVILFIAQGVFIGRIRGNAIRVSERQFPDAHRIATQLAKAMELKNVPTIYIIQAGGALNAFATKFFSRNFIVVFSDILELAYEHGEDAVAFVLAHELAHLKRRHLTWRWFISPALFIPFLGTAYQRAAEYTCDRYGTRYAPDGAAAGILVLAVGKRLYKDVDLKEVIQQSGEDRGFWIGFAEALATHPNITKRVLEIERFRTASTTKK